MSINNMSHQTPCSWANLPPDLLLCIADRLDATTFIRLTAVCTSWASTIHPYLPSFPPIRRNQPVPWLLCYAQSSNTGNCTNLTFYDLGTAAYYSLRIPIPSLRGHHWMGSYKDWLVTLDRQLQLHLIKPLTGAHVLLPFKGIKKMHPKKVIMCQSPDNTNELQAFWLTQQGGLVSSKLGDKSWSWMANYGTGYQDIAVHQGKVYAVSTNILFYWKIGSSSTKRSIFPEFLHWWRTKFLIECNGELLILIIGKEERVSLENHAPKQVRLYKFKRGDHGFLLSHVSSLGDDALFFGANCSYMVSSFGRDDIQGNCIYFTNQMSRCFHDAETFHPNHNFGRFDLGKQTYYKPCCPQDSPRHLLPPIWFLPR
ncbi:F-box protein [Carex littledalei]|uniref:F-box protein n=1 Tax=Carex littledalei TaxID=544730 RepID=A0A833RBF7_9POAL|nr:F-box protein [Carex littledalei]